MIASRRRAVTRAGFAYAALWTAVIGLMFMAVGMLVTRVIAMSVCAKNLPTPALSA
jgi:hypothetical protein